MRDHISGMSFEDWTDSTAKPMTETIPCLVGGQYGENFKRITLVNKKQNFSIISNISDFLVEISDAKSVLLADLYFGDIWPAALLEEIINNSNQEVLKIFLCDYNDSEALFFEKKYKSNGKCFFLMKERIKVYELINFCNYFYVMNLARPKNFDKVS